MDQSGSETYSPRSFDWHSWISVDHLLITSNQVPPILEWFCSIMPVTTDPESQPRESHKTDRATGSHLKGKLAPRESALPKRDDRGPTDPESELAVPAPGRTSTHG